MFASATFIFAASLFGATDTIYSDTFDLAADGCPDTSLRLLSSRIRYPDSNNSVRASTDLTVFENLWGHATSTDGVVPWPGGNQYVPALLDFDKVKFVAARFHVPAGFPVTDYGFFVYSSYYSGPRLTLSMTQRCGDFTPANALCATTVGTGEMFGKWRIAPNPMNCPLMPDTDYFVNIKLADPQPTDCGGSANCALAIGNVLGH